ncbi:metallophosphoesterase [Methylobacterium sp. WCS2018Hpa-22]|uniref:metallophosphoesterase n=1 Tax=Methylobacterium sp. WCS2018Hpa-22 TaxID=3073633 RepID=UPI00288AA399|nr:metallophosphoesterase [Methylobacterium sp. WCS2018Hpa-22]
MKLNRTHHINLTPPKGTVWLTGDTHFGHAGSIAQSKRPFRDVAEMDRLLIEAWNSCVRANDTVIHAGDFEWGHTPERAAQIFQALKGRKHLIVGNHDRARVTDLPWESVQERLTVHAGGRRIVCDHYPMRAWPGAFRGVLHVHGHTHGSLPGTSQSCDVGVDCWGYAPARVEDVIARMEATPNLPEERLRAADREAEDDA